MNANQRDTVERLVEIGRIEVESSITQAAITATRDALIRQAGATAERVVNVSLPAHQRKEKRILKTASVSSFAAVVVFVAALASWFHLGQASARTVFAQVQEAIASAKTTTFRILDYADDTLIHASQVTVVDPDLLRADTGRELHIMNFPARQFMSVYREERRVQILPIYDLPNTRTLVMGAYAQLRDLPVQSARRRVSTIVDGRAVIEVTLRMLDTDALVVVDAETKLPMRIQMDQGILADGKRRTEVLTDFQFNEEVDRAEFAIEPPAGYAVEIVELRESAGESWESFVIKDGLGPVRFGMAKEQVVLLFGKPDKIVTNVGMTPQKGTDEDESAIGWVPAQPKYTIDTLHYDSRGFRVQVSSLVGMQSVECFNQEAMGPTVRDFEGRTAEGIRLGASRDDVVRAYGQPDDQPPDSTMITYSELGWIFSFRDGNLATIVGFPAMDSPIRSRLPSF